MTRSSKERLAKKTREWFWVRSLKLRAGSQAILTNKKVNTKANRKS